MAWYIKSFKDLSTLELHKIYKERINIFIIEQNCPVEEIDDIDLKSIHIFKVNENKDIIAYGRIFEKDNYIYFGRIIVKKEFRGQKLGKELIKNILIFIKTKYKNKKIKIHAQSHLEKFYSSFGFKKDSEIYIYDNRKHIDMTLNI